MMHMTLHGTIEQKDRREDAGKMQRYLSEENFERLRALMHPVKASAGTYLFWEGDPADRLFYIHSGRVKLKKDSEDGQELTLSLLGQGDLIAEYGGTSVARYGFSAEIMEDAHLGQIKLDELELLMLQYGGFALELMKWSGLYQRIMCSRLRDLLAYGRSGALASTLIRLSNTYGIACSEGIRLDIKLTNSEMAKCIGSTRESVNRLLNHWKEEGAIALEQGGTIIIKRLCYLRKICHCPADPLCPKEICRM
jgi:CRP-like cAMP-binding protein